MSDVAQNFRRRPLVAILGQRGLRALRSYDIKRIPCAVSAPPEGTLPPRAAVNRCIILDPYSQSVQ